MNTKVSNLSEHEYAKEVLKFIIRKKKVEVEFIFSALGRPFTTKRFKTFISEMLPQVIYRDNFLSLPRLSSSQYAKEVRKMVMKDGQVNLNDLDKLFARPNSTLPFGRFIQQFLPEMTYSNNVIAPLKKPSASASNTTPSNHSFMGKIMKQLREEFLTNPLKDSTTHSTNSSIAAPDSTNFSDSDSTLPQLLNSTSPNYDYAHQDSTFIETKLDNKKIKLNLDDPQSNGETPECNNNCFRDLFIEQEISDSGLSESKASISTFVETNSIEDDPFHHIKDDLEPEVEMDTEYRNDKTIDASEGNESSLKFLNSTHPYIFIATDNQFENYWPCLRNILLQNTYPITIKCQVETSNECNAISNLALLQLGLFWPKTQEYHAILLSGKLKEKNLRTLISFLVRQRGLFGHNIHKEMKIFDKYNDYPERAILIDTQLVLEFYTKKLHNSWMDLYGYFGISVPEEAPTLMEKVKAFSWKPGNICADIPSDILRGVTFEVTILGRVCQTICAKLSHDELRMVEEASLYLSSPKEAKLVHENSNYFPKSTSLIKSNPEESSHIVDAIPFSDKLDFNHFFPPNFCAKYPPILFHESKKITIDLNQKPVFTSRDSYYIGEFEVDSRQMTECLSYLGRIGSDNRIIVDKALHRISIIRDKSDRICGITYLPKYHYYQSSSLIKDLYMSRNNHQYHGIIVFGKMKSGKSTILRDAAINIATDRSLNNVSVIDTKQDILGNGDQPYFKHPKCRRILNNGKHQNEIILDCIHNQAPSHIVVDEIMSREDVNALYVAKQAGVQFIAGFCGSFKKYLKLCTTNNDLSNSTEIAKCPFRVAIFLLNSDPLEIDIVPNFKGAIKSFKNNPDALVQVERRTRIKDVVRTKLFMKEVQSI